VWGIATTPPSAQTAPITPPLGRIPTMNGTEPPIRAEIKRRSTAGRLIEWATK
jgi:hypothetical protein